MLERECDTTTVEVEAGQLRLFANAVGETRPVCLDIRAAREAGYRSILAPPTFGNALILLADPDGSKAKARLKALGMPIEGGLFHAEERFEYFDQIYAGDRIAVITHVVDVFEKKRGQLRFAVFLTVLTNQFGQVVQRVHSTAFVKREDVIDS